jgi:hypothetical protein
VLEEALGHDVTRCRSCAVLRGCLLTIESDCSQHFRKIAEP